MSTTLNEWLQKTIAELEEERDSVPGAVNEDAAMALAAMKLALESLEAEPVAFRSKLKPPSAIGSESWGYTDHRQPDAFELESCVIERLYTAPPAPFVPDEINVLQAANLVLTLGVLDNGIPTVAMKVWNACRAAMLQGADGNSPVIPDGWVACSERMPHIGVPVITCCGDVVQYAAYAWDGKEWQDWYEEYDKLPASTFTHWHPRPAAPQQEVK
ncbi:hypothetical protein ASU86_00590 [Enterobacter hormaechei subsp. steigerwaltii]|uniref:DUF551 domain-containing protein n=1 Tax=Enterobacter hormaechei TaxID=158836 RepID=UPI00073543F1|nr:DUF551 domain-containing protein [Enterobacter hormaechei]KTJ33741.1 hypothetical protein ASU86_00590 [Enterobacter hormaechei subsp. steigerwaltii]